MRGGGRGACGRCSKRVGGRSRCGFMYIFGGASCVFCIDLDVILNRGHGCLLEAMPDVACVCESGRTFHLLSIRCVYICAFSAL